MSTFNSFHVKIGAHMVTLPEFKAGRAEFCRIERVTDLGPGDEYFVRLPDGYLLPCGTRRDGERRAEVITGLVNVLMRWEGSWPPAGAIEYVIQNNFVDELRYRASLGEPVPDLTYAP